MKSTSAPQPPISARTKLCAVIGNPIGHSLSPAIHNAAFRATGADFAYVAFRVEDLRGALEGLRSFENFRGLSVTIPHKVEAIQLVDEVDEVDRKIGAINTILNENGRLRGFGTDGPGALKAIRDTGVQTEDATVFILGAGGAARAIAFALETQGGAGRIFLSDMNEKVLLALEKDLKHRASTRIEGNLPTPDFLEKAVAESNIIINCTPVGMHPHEDATPIPTGLLREGQTVFDVVYNPLKTRFLREAEALGCKVIPGAEMFINQAVLQFEAFTGLRAPEQVMRDVVMENLSK